MSVASERQPYYVSDKARWPIVGSIGMMVTMIGLSLLFNERAFGAHLAIIGVLVIIYMCVMWFREVIHESENGLYSQWEDQSFRIGMYWFIFSEVMFFAAFFGALLYARVFSIPWLLGEGDGADTHHYLWSAYSELWPTNGPEDLGGSDFHMPWWPLPFINTMILLTSGLTLTFAHHALKVNHRSKFVLGLFLTVLLGFIFLGLQVYEYFEAYHYGMTLESGIYGSTFFMMTGFHGFHVLLGVVMLTVMLARALAGHFTPDRHFAFEAAAWYWHFVDVVWLLLFVLIYII